LPAKASRIKETDRNVDHMEMRDRPAVIGSLVLGAVCALLGLVAFAYADAVVGGPVGQGLASAAFQMGIVLAELSFLPAAHVLHRRRRIPSWVPTLLLVLAVLGTLGAAGQLSAAAGKTLSLRL
jgi:hypothetical protein